MPPCANAGPATLYQPKSRKMIPTNIRTMAMVNFKPSWSSILVTRFLNRASQPKDARASVYKPIDVKLAKLESRPVPELSAIEGSPRAARLSTRSTLVLLCIAELLAMSLWFSGTAVLPQLAQQWRAGLGVTSWLTLAVQLGFVMGALLSAIFNLADVFSARRVLVVSAVAAAIFNLGFAMWAAESILAAMVFRFLTGAALAGVYPVGMKILAGWFRQGRGLALGWMVGALSVGSALPHGIGALGGVGDNTWRAAQPLVLASSGLALLGAIIMALFVRNGPFAAASPPFDPAQAGEVFRNRRLALANFGYLGHMWELYSMWAWIAVMLGAAGEQRRSELELAVFVIIGLGAMGCVWAGRGSDGAGATLQQRSRGTITSMAGTG